MTEQLWSTDRIEALAKRCAGDAACRYAVTVALTEMWRECSAEIERLQREVDEAEKAQSLCYACGNELAAMVTP